MPLMKIVRFLVFWAIFPEGNTCTQYHTFFVQFFFLTCLFESNLALLEHALQRRTKLRRRLNRENKICAITAAHRRHFLLLQYPTRITNIGTVVT